MKIELDRKLAELVKPLVDLKVQLAAAPHVNTLCLAYHYRLAHGRKRVPDGRIQLADWNRDWSNSSLLRDLHGLYMFYSSKDVADKLKALRVSGGGYFNSIPVTRFRQQHVFLRRNDANRAVLDRLAGRSIRDVAEELLTPTSERAKPFVVTDILPQAKCFARAVSTDRNPRYLYPGMILGDASQRDDDAAIFIFSAPSSEYMEYRTDNFIRLEIDGLSLTDEDEYETHIIWHMPENSRRDDNITITRAVRAYHAELYLAASQSEGSGFEGLGRAIGQTLSTRHPSFGSVVLRNVGEFRKCLWNYHSDPSPLATARDAGTA